MEDIRKHIEELEASRRQAMMAGDFAQLGSIIAPDALYVHSNAVSQSGADFVNSVRDGIYRYNYVMQPEMDIRILGDIAMVSGRMMFSVLLSDGSEKNFESRTVAIWSSDKGKWLAKHIQGTPIPQ